MPVDEETAGRILELTRQLRDESNSDLETRRVRLLDAAGVCAYEREDEHGTTLVLYPSDWVGDDGLVDPASVDDLEAAVELPLETRRTEEMWDEIEAHNRAVAEAVTDRHGPVHGATASTLGTYLGNHHLRRIENATAAELQTFREDYLVRNAWPSHEQLTLLGRSLEFTLAMAKRRSGREDLILEGSKQ